MRHACVTQAMQRVMLQYYDVMMCCLCWRGVACGVGTASGHCTVPGCMLQTSTPLQLLASPPLTAEPASIPAGCVAARCV